MGVCDDAVLIYGSPKSSTVYVVKWAFLDLQPASENAVLASPKGQVISKANCQDVNSSKKRTNEFVFTTMQRVFVPFFGRNWRHQKNISKLSDL